MASRVVRPETKTLQISGGDWLLVKKRLNSGEQRESYARMSLPGTLRVNPMATGIALIVAYLLDWSLTDEDGQTLVIRGVNADALTAHVNRIDYESFVEIKEAIEQHEQAMAVERAVEKNALAGEKNGPAISPSPSEPAGASSGSAS